jgi:hypothetical protein
MHHEVRSKDAQGRLGGILTEINIKTDSISSIHISAFGHFVYVTGVGQPVSDDDNGSQGFPVWALQYSGIDSQKETTAQPIHAEVVQIKGVRRYSMPSVTTLLMCSWVSTIQSDGTVQTQVINFLDFTDKRQEFRKRSLKSQFCFEKWPSMPTYQETPSAIGPCQSFKATSVDLSGYTKAEYCPSGLGAEPASLIMRLPSSQKSLMSMAAVDGIDTRLLHLMELMEEKDKLPRKPLVSSDEIERAAPQSQETSEANALCSLCTSALADSELLQQSSFWRERSVAQMARPEVRDGILQTRDHTQHPPHKHHDGAKWKGTEEQPRMEAGPDTESETVFKDAASPLYEPRYEHFQHHSTWESLAASIISGCHLCTMFKTHVLSLTNFEATIKRVIGDLHVFTTDDIKAGQTPTGSLASYWAESILTKTTSRLPEKPEREWLHKSTTASESGNELEDVNFHLRVSSEPGHNPYARGQVTLYIPAERDGARPKWKCSVPIGRLMDVYSEDKNQQGLMPGDSPRQSHPKYTSSIETIALARKWLAECTNSHACAVKSPEARPPTRLIDTQPLNGQDNLRLVITGDKDKGLEYLTMSHCWGLQGGRASALLTKGSLQRFIAGFSVDDLPATFRDAVIACQALNQRYIWIDSLCIIQDDPEDWKAEAARMASIYEGSLCNLSASSSFSVDSGLFTLRRNYEFTNL